MWQYMSAPSDSCRIVLFEYQPGRGAVYPQAFLKGFNGFLSTDGYSAYNGLGYFLAACIAHIRRKFFDAYKAMGKDPAANSPAAIGMAYCDKLFELEREYNGMEPIERFYQRLYKSLPVALELFVWAKSVEALPKSLLGKALTYLDGQKPKTINIFRDGRLEISTMAAENSFRPYVVGRKAWLFSNTGRGAKASATVYSIVETAKANGLNPESYIEHILEQCRGARLNVPAESLLPWGDSIPDSCFHNGAKKPKPPDPAEDPIVAHADAQLSKMHLLSEWQLFI